MTDRDGPPGAALLAALQLGDSAFPTGRYTLSHGLESFVEHGHVRSAADLEPLLGDYVTAAGSSEAVAVAVSCRAAADGDLATVVAVDELLLATKLPAESAASATRTGRTLLAAARRLCDDAVLADYAARVDAGQAPGTHGVAFGVTAAAWGLTPVEAALVELYSFVSGLLGAALRTVRLDHVAAQGILRRLAPRLHETARAAARTHHEDISAFAPRIEVMQMAHERSRLRLFAS